MKRIKMRIFPDGRIQAEVAGIKGKACTNVIRILEQILDAESLESSYTPEYYESLKLKLDQSEEQQVENKQSLSF